MRQEIIELRHLKQNNKKYLIGIFTTLTTLGSTIEHVLLNKDENNE